VRLCEQPRSSDSLNDLIRVRLFASFQSISVGIGVPAYWRDGSRSRIADSTSFAATTGAAVRDASSILSLRSRSRVARSNAVAHAFVGVGNGPCVLLAAGNRPDDSVTVRPRADDALRHGAGVEEETTSFPHAKYGPWRHERPGRWPELPWAG
jgi:hypothetical protein